MHFRTEYKGPVSQSSINHNSRVLSIGSCFSTHMATRLDEYKFQILNNPYGTVYNPISILDSLFYQTADFESFYVNRDSRIVNYLCHSDMSGADKNDLESKLKKQAEKVQHYLEKTSHLILTFGSAKVYELKNDDSPIVANCHKVHSNKFNDRYLDLSEIVESFIVTYEKLRKINPLIKIILTVSPVRYLADGLEMSQYGKSVLRVACQQIADTFDDVEYFPSYELLIDDLRDYRFYEEDLIHPNDQAIEYIWNKFTERYLNDETMALNAKIQKIRNGVNHRPFNPSSQEYKGFLQRLLSDINKLPGNLNFDSEKVEITNRLDELLI